MKIETVKQAKQYILERVGAELSYRNNLEDLLNRYAKALLKAKTDEDIELLISSLVDMIVDYIETLATAKVDDADEKTDILLFITAERNGESMRQVITRHVRKWQEGLSSDGENTGYYPLVRYGRFMIAWGWTKFLFDEAAKNGAVAYNVFRGSSYPCSTCDYECSYVHYKLDSLPPYHASCKCYVVPIYQPGLL